MRIRQIAVLATILGGFVMAETGAQAPIEQYVTDAQRTRLLALQPEKLSWNRTHVAPDDAVRIHLDPAQRMQRVDGFGFALTGGSAQLLMRMTPAARHSLLLQTFGSGPGQMHVSYLRVTIGASDMNDHVYTYDDLPPGETDPELRHFSLAADKADVIPVLKEILAIQPGMKLLASPWTAPSWMKTNNLPKGGTLKPDDYPVYAAYLVRYLRDMQREGIRIDAITPQNEPLNPKNTPSMVLEPEQERTFVHDNLGPALDKADLRTRIIVFDHNCNRPDYAEAILADPQAAKYVDGSGFHLYEGTIDAMSTVHDAYPAKNLYFTEQMTVEHMRNGKPEPVALPVAHVMIGAMRNWSRNVLLWNFAADPSFGPHTGDGGCPVCQGAITLDGDRVERNIGLYTVAQFSRFVPPGSVRIASDEADANIANVAFQTPDERTMLVVTNLDDHARNIVIEQSGAEAVATLAAGDAVTYVWQMHMAGGK